MWILTIKAFPVRSLFHKPEINVVYFDASKKGSGYVYQRDPEFTDWRIDISELENVNINRKVIIYVILAVGRWTPLQRYYFVLIIDNI